MGLLDRLHQMVTAAGGALEAPVGLVKDVTLALPELGTLNFPDFTGDVYHAFTNRGAQLLTGAVGPQGVGGSIIGAVPSGVRKEATGILNPAQDAMDFAYHELVGQPLATAITAGTIGAQEGPQALLSGRTLAESYNIAEHRSPGQSLALAFMTSDIRNPAQVRKAQGSDWYQAISGVTDAVSRTFLDPTALALGYTSSTLKAARAVNYADDIARLTASGALDEWALKISDLVAEHGDGAAAVIRHTYFPRDPYGGQWADVLANAHTLPRGLVDGLSGPEAVKRVTRILMGATDELPALEATRADLGGAFKFLTERREMVKSMSINGDNMVNAPDELAALERTIDAMYPQIDRLDRLNQRVGNLTTLPRTEGLGARLRGYTATDTWQNGPFTKFLRTEVAHRPPHILNLEDPRGDIGFWRLINKSDLPVTEQLAWRAKYQAASTAADRLTVAIQGEEAAVRSIIDPTGMSREAVDALLGEAARARGAAIDTLNSRVYDGAGRSKMIFEDENGALTQMHMLEYPIWGTQLPNSTALVDLDKVREVLNPMKSFLVRHPGYAVPEDYLHRFATLWKRSVLLRVGFPAKFVTDEILRSVGKIGVFATTKNVLAGVGDATRAALNKGGIHVEQGIFDGPVLAGHSFDGAFGAGGDGAGIFRNMLGARDAWGTLIDESEGKVLDDLIKAGADWRSVAPTEAAHGAAWEHAVNKQIGQDTLGSHMLEQMTDPLMRTSAVEPDLLVVDGISNEFVHGDTVNEAGRALLGNDEAKIAHAHELIDQSIEHRLKGAITEHDATAADPGAALRNLEREMDPTALGAEGHAAVHADAEAALDRFFYDELVAAQGHPYTNLPGNYAKAVEHGRVFTHLPKRPREQVINETVDWLRNSEEGQALARQLPARRNRLEEWVGASYDQIDSYLPTDQLKAAAWGGHATYDQLVAQFPNAADRPIVHGSVLANNLSSPGARMFRKLMDGAMNNIVSKPSHYLVRQRFFDHMYQAELGRQVRIFMGKEVETSLPERMRNLIAGRSSHVEGDLLEHVDVDQLRQMQVNARRYAWGQTKDLFHDFTEEYQFAHALGFIAPFANAAAQITSRWAGIAMDNPAYVRRLQIIWRAPERAGLVTDGAGNVVDEHGKIIDPVPNSQYRKGDAAADGERFVTVPFGGLLSNMPGVKEMTQGKGIRFGKESLNLLVHGLPSFGPMVQVGLNEIVKTKPELESTFKFALPFGVSENSLDPLVPTIFRSVRNQYEGDSNRSYANVVMRLYSDRLVDYNLGKREKPPTWDEVKTDASHFWNLRRWAGFVLPATPLFTSPYQPYIDAYRAYKELDAKLTPQQKALPSYKTPDETFLDNFGAEFFPLVASMSKSVDALPPTLEGFQLEKKYGDFIAKHPSAGPLLAGSEGAGEFNYTVYLNQFAKGERRSQTPAEYATQASTRLGWIEFGREMDKLDAMLAQRGLSSYRVKAASDLQATKQALVYYLANDPNYTGWYEDYTSTDESKWDHRINDFTALTRLDGMKDRPEIKALGEYLDARKSVVEALQEMGAKRLDNQAASGLQAAFEAYATHLVESNPMFGAVYNRWLVNDPVALTPITQTAEAGRLPSVGVTP